MTHIWEDLPNKKVNPAKKGSVRFYLGVYIYIIVYVYTYMCIKISVYIYTCIFEKRWWARNLNINLKGLQSHHPTKLLADMTKKIRFDFPCLRKNICFSLPDFLVKKSPGCSQSFFLGLCMADCPDRSLPRCEDVSKSRGLKFQMGHLLKDETIWWGCRVPKFRDGIKFDMYIYI